MHKINKQIFQKRRRLNLEKCATHGGLGLSTSFKATERIDIDMLTSYPDLDNTVLSLIQVFLHCAY